MTKTDELQKLERQLLKKENEKVRCEQTIATATQKCKQLDSDIKLIQARIVAENLARQNMTFKDLNDLLSQKREEAH